jgi:hypothetical protein
MAPGGLQRLYRYYCTAVFDGCISVLPFFEQSAGQAYTYSILAKTSEVKKNAGSKKKVDRQNVEIKKTLYET